MRRHNRMQPPSVAISGCQIIKGERVVIEAFIGAGVGVLTIASARSIHGERWLYSRV